MQLLQGHSFMLPAPHVLYNRALKIAHRTEMEGGGQIKQKNTVIQTALGIFSISHCAVSPAPHHADELHPDLVAISMQENMQTNKAPSSFRAKGSGFERRRDFTASLCPLPLWVLPTPSTVQKHVCWHVCYFKLTLSVNLL